MTKQFSNYSDLITFTRASKGHALRPVSYGDELVTNGTFDTDSDWTLQRVSIAGGVADFSDNSLGPARVIQDDVYTVGKIYLVTFDVNESGTLRVYDGAGYDGDISVSSGTVSKIIYAEGTQFIIRANVTNDYTGTIDNISVKEVTFDQPDGTLTLFEHPNDIPRVEFDAQGNRLGLLVEESRTNLVTYSDVDTTNWTGGAFANISTESVSNPFGFSSVVKVVPTTDTAGGAPKRTVQKSINVTTGTTYTYSAFVKAAGYNAAYIIFTDRPNVYGGVAYDLSTASLIELDGGNQGTLSNPFIEDFGDGWYRIGFSHDGDGGKDASNGVAVGFVPTGLTKTVNYGQSSFAGDGISGGYVAGVQVEAGSFPTSYIKTTVNTAIRSADVASIPVADFGYNQSAGTVFVEAKASGDSLTFPRVISFQDDPSNRWELIGDTTLDVRIFHRSNGTTDVSSDIISNVLDGETSFKLAYAKAENDAAGSGNGGSVVTDTSNGQLNNVDTLYIGVGANGSSDFLNGHIKSIKYYPRRLSDAQLVELTS